MRKFNIIILLFIVFSGIMKGESLVSSADSAYNAGNYSEAIALYNDVLNEQGSSAALLFNLGNAYLQQDDYGNAMLCYRRAKKLDPSNSKINSNLNYLTGKVEDANKAEQKGKRKKVTEDTPNFFENVHSSVATNTSSNAWAAWGAGFFILFSGCVCLYLFNSNVLMRKTGFFGGFILLGLSMISIVCAYSGAAEAENHDYGIVLTYKTSLQTEPASGNKETDEGILTRGTRVRIISEEIDAEGNVSWYKVRLNTDYIGWVPASDIGII